MTLEVPPSCTSLVAHPPTWRPAGGCSPMCHPPSSLQSCQSTRPRRPGEWGGDHGGFSRENLDRKPCFFLPWNWLGCPVIFPIIQFCEYDDMMMKKTSKNVKSDHTYGDVYWFVFKKQGAVPTSIHSIWLSRGWSLDNWSLPNIDWLT